MAGREVVPVAVGAATTIAGGAEVVAAVDAPVAEEADVAFFFGRAAVLTSRLQHLRHGVGQGRQGEARLECISWKAGSSAAMSPCTAAPSGCACSLLGQPANALCGLLSLNALKRSPHGAA